MFSLQRLLQAEKTARRAASIIGVLAKYGLAPWLKRVPLDALQKQLVSIDGRPVADTSYAERVRMALTELGSTYIKLGQMLSTRPDLVGPELTGELEKLQSSTPADSIEQVRETIETELGKPIEELFQEFTPEALASASIGQVHKAVLHDGRKVVVKVQHAGIEDKIQQDMVILKSLAELAEHYAEELRNYQPVHTIEEFSRGLNRELDFRRELRNIETFRQNFKDDERSRFTWTVSELSSKRVLTQEQFDGVSLQDREPLEATGIDLSTVARNGATTFLDMIFRDGFYHADPHPGNLLLLSDGKIGILDCGMVGRIDDQLRDDLEGALLAVSTGDSEELCDIVTRLGSCPHNLDFGRLRLTLKEFVDDYSTQTVDGFDLSGALNGLFAIVREYQIILPSGCSMLLKVLIMLEGTSSNLNPDFSLVELLEPYQADAIRRRLSPKTMLKRAQKTYREWDRLIQATPRHLQSIMEQISRGEMDVNLQHRRLEPVIDELVNGILTAALFLGSAMLWSREASPLTPEFQFIFLFKPISIPGLAGATISVMMGMRLLRRMRKRRSSK